MCRDPVKSVVSCDNVTESVGMLDCFCTTSYGDKDNTTVVGINFVFTTVQIMVYSRESMIYSI